MMRKRERIDTLIDGHVWLSGKRRHGKVAMSMSDEVDSTLHRVLISKDEFKRAIEFVEGARRHNESEIEYEALVHSAIIFYARPFTNNEGPRRDVPRGAQQLTGIDVPTVLGEDFAFHERIVNLRMKVVAHSEACVQSSAAYTAYYRQPRYVRRSFSPADLERGI